MAVFRLPPVAQFQQPRVYADRRTVDAPLPATNEPLQQVVWLRRRHDYEVDQQQPRRLLHVSITASVDPPLPATNEPLQQLCWLRRRYDYEAEQQSRRLVDLGVSASVDAPPLALRGQWTPTSRSTPGAQARGLPPDVLAPFVPPDAPTGAVVQPPSTVRPVSWVPYTARPTLDVSYTQSVDQPPTLAVQAPQEPRARWQGQQAPPLAIDLLAPTTGPLGVAQQTVGYLRVTSWQQWLQAEHVDTGVTQSVDAPPALIRLEPPPPATSGIQYRQPTARYMAQPDAPAGQAPLEVYARQVAATQAWQKSPPIAHLLPVVEAPPLTGPWQPAAYRRPVPVPPVVRQLVGALLAPAPTADPNPIAISLATDTRVAARTVTAVRPMTDTRVTVDTSAGVGLDSESELR